MEVFAMITKEYPDAKIEKRKFASLLPSTYSSATSYPIMFAFANIMRTVFLI